MRQIKFHCISQRLFIYMEPKQKNSSSTQISFNVFFITTTTASAFDLCLSSSLLSYSYCLVETMPRNFQGFGECRFGGSEKDPYFLKIPKWQLKLIQKYKRGKLASFFLDNAAKICSHGLKILENIEIKHAFQSKSFFHHINFLHTSCLSPFKGRLMQILKCPCMFVYV